MRPDEHFNFRNCLSKTQTVSDIYSTGRAVFAIATTAIHQEEGGQHIYLPLYTPIGPRDRAVFAISATAAHQRGQI